MFTLLMSLGLVATVGISGYTFSRKMDELFNDPSGQAASDTRFG